MSKSKKTTKPVNKAKKLGATKSKGAQRPAEQAGAQRSDRPREADAKAKAGTPAKVGKADQKGAPTKPVRVERETQHLAVQLTDSEIDDRRHLVNRLLLDIAKTKAQASSFAATSKANIATLEGQLSNAARELDSGQVFADVPCNRIWDYQKKQIRVERTDTKEVISCVAMSKDDLQMTIPGVDPTKPKGPSKDKLPRAVTKSATEKLNSEADQSASELKARATKTKPDVSDDPYGRNSWNSDETDEDDPVTEAPDSCGTCGHPYVLGYDKQLRQDVRIPGCQCEANRMAVTARELDETDPIDRDDDDEDDSEDVDDDYDIED